MGLQSSADETTLLLTRGQLPESPAVAVRSSAEEQRH